MARPSHCPLNVHNILGEHDLPREERFCIPLRRAALHTAQPGQTSERLVVEPMFGSLASEVFQEEGNLAIEDGRR